MTDREMQWIGPRTHCLVSDTNDGENLSVQPAHLQLHVRHVTRLGITKGANMPCAGISNLQSF